MNEEIPAPMSHTTQMPQTTQMPHVSTAPQHHDVAPEIKKAASSQRKKTRSRLAQIISLLCLLLLAFLWWRFLGDRPEKAASRGRNEAVPVEIAAATEKDVPVQIKGIGNVEALSTVAVRSQIEGTLQTVHFTPGQEVKKGDLLFTIDPRPLQAALNQAEANLIKAMAAVQQAQDIVARDQATAKNSKIIADRDAKLIEDGVISREEYDNAVSKAQADEATVRSDQSSVANLQAAVKAEQANVENARVQLGYTLIRAPISGKTGNLAITAGNLIRANDTTAMVTITQTTPIYVTFSVPEPDLLRIRQYSGSSDFKVEVVIPGDESHPAQGKLSLVDNTVDTTTGTIKLKATFENADRRLFPGQFVNVVLTLGMQHNATVVPSQAVQIGQDSSFVYVVKPDMTAEVRNVKTGATIDNMTVINEGLKPGEQVVTDGQLRLVPGAKVQPRSGQGGRGAGAKGNQDNPAGGSQSAGRERRQGQ
jgi:multidrug efflux system membrane fusion protein